MFFPSLSLQITDKSFLVQEIELSSYGTHSVTANSISEMKVTPIGSLALDSPLTL